MITLCNKYNKLSLNLFRTRLTVRFTIKTSFRYIVILYGKTTEITFLFFAENNHILIHQHGGVTP